MTDALKDETQLASGGAVLARSLCVLQGQSYAFQPQVSTIISKIAVHKIFLMTVMNLHHFLGFF
jgi:hypothetical protein